MGLDSTITLKLIWSIITFTELGYPRSKLEWNSGRSVSKALRLLKALCTFTRSCFNTSLKTADLYSDNLSKRIEILGYTTSFQMTVYHYLKNPTMLQKCLSQNKIGECIPHPLFSFIQNEKSPLRDITLYRTQSSTDFKHQHFSLHLSQACVQLCMSSPLLLLPLMPWTAKHFLSSNCS